MEKNLDKYKIGVKIDWREGQIKQYTRALNKMSPQIVKSAKEHQENRFPILSLMKPFIQEKRSIKKESAYLRKIFATALNLIP